LEIGGMLLLINGTATSVSGIRGKICKYTNSIDRV